MLPGFTASEFTTPPAKTTPRAAAVAAAQYFACESVHERGSQGLPIGCRNHPAFGVKVANRPIRLLVISGVHQPHIDFAIAMAGIEGISWHTSRQGNKGSTGQKCSNRHSF